MPDENTDQQSSGQQTDTQNANQQPPSNQQPSGNDLDPLLKIANATTLQDAIKWAENANSRLGNSISLPNEPDAEANRLIQEKLAARGYDVMLRPDMSDPEQAATMKQLLGVPDSIDGYVMPEQTDELQYNTAAAEKFRESAFKHGIPVSAFEAMLNDVVQDGMAAQSQYKEAEAQNMDALKSELGYAFDEKVNQAGELMKIINPDYDPSNASSNEIRGMMRLMEYMGEMSSEVQNFNRPTENTRMTPDEAKVKIQEIMNEMDSLNFNDPKYKVLAKQKRELYKEAYPDGITQDGTARVGGIKFGT